MHHVQVDDVVQAAAHEHTHRAVDGRYGAAQPVPVRLAEVLHEGCPELRLAFHTLLLCNRGAATGNEECPELRLAFACHSKDQLARA